MGQTVDVTLPPVTIWVTPQGLKNITKGMHPGTWYTINPIFINKNTTFIQIMVPYSFFQGLQQEKEDLDSKTADLPF